MGLYRTWTALAREARRRPHEQFGLLSSRGNLPRNEWVKAQYHPDLDAVVPLWIDFRKASPADLAKVVQAHTGSQGTDFEIIPDQGLDFAGSGARLSLALMDTIQRASAVLLQATPIWSDHDVAAGSPTGSTDAYWSVGFSGGISSPTDALGSGISNAGSGWFTGGPFGALASSGNQATRAPDGVPGSGRFASTLQVTPLNDPLRVSMLQGAHVLEAAGSGEGWGQDNPDTVLLRWPIRKIFVGCIDTNGDLTLTGRLVKIFFAWYGSLT